MHDQADELRQLMRQRAAASPPAARTPLVAVNGGRSGVGTTTIATNLAIAFARAGRRTVLVDADLEHGGKLPAGDGLPRGTVGDVVAGRRTVHDSLERGPLGVQVLSGVRSPHLIAHCTATEQQRLIDQLQRLAPHADVVVLDVGSCRGPLARRFWQAAQAVLAVTTTDVDDVLECYTSIKLLLAGSASMDVHTLVNHVQSSADAAEAQARIAEACRRFLGLRVLAGEMIPECSVSSEGQPLGIFASRGDAARALDCLADRLWEQFETKNDSTRGLGLADTRDTSNSRTGVKVCRLGKLSRASKALESELDRFSGVGPRMVSHDN